MQVPDDEAHVDAVRRSCAHLPEVEERLSHGTPTFFLRGKRPFVYVWWRGHHDIKFPHMWCAAALGTQQEMTGAEPERFFRPPYVGHRGWIGVRLDVGIEGDELAELCEDAYRTLAPARLIRRLEEQPH